MSFALTSSPDQIPARMINEYAYCPRLFYLEYVQQEWAHSADTLEGRFAHRRVDQEKGTVPAPDDLTAETHLHARSVMIGSEKLGAVARIDLIEGEGTRVTPVDYKRGAPPNIPEGAWEPERVQLCLQGLLLRENDYPCNEGVLYFAETQARVVIPFTEQLIARTLELLAGARQTAASGVIPPPLVQSPKCPRCSLVGICLPDEVNFLRTTVDTPAPTSPPGEIRRLAPARDDNLAVYVQGQGYNVGLKGEVLEIREKGRAVSEARLLEISQVNLYGNVQISAQALRELAAREVPILHLSYGGWLSAITTPPPHKNIELRRRQFQSADDARICLALARSFVSGKIRNTRTLLRRNAQSLPDGLLYRLAEARRRAGRAAAIDQLLGIEGSAACHYFSHFILMFKAGAKEANQFDFQSRNRRPPRDPVNALLSFLYSMLVKEVVITLIGVGLDPYLGFYHQPRYGRPALALDMMEEFRPLIADSIVIGMINNGEVRRSDFIERAGAAALTDGGRKRVIEAYERRLDVMVTHPRFGYAISYRRILEVQARLLARFLTGEINSYPPFYTR
ncbi:MAG: CRISPR-associated endonuclease Cas1 [Acidobacteria bacterium]|nr:CRISPR-associated endonuclease Cas1 [Acidobacteriota bacterium]MBI3657497.1 CRISPR-associated endonuclease Cas1 [Acidobacteriota bacterium]